MLILSVVIDSGSRYEVSYPSGISHFLEKLAFNVNMIYHYYYTLSFIIYHYTFIIFLMCIFMS